MRVNIHTNAWNLRLVAEAALILQDESSWFAMAKVVAKVLLPSLGFSAIAGSACFFINKDTVLIKGG